MGRSAFCILFDDEVGQSEFGRVGGTAPNPTLNLLNLMLIHQAVDFLAAIAAVRIQRIQLCALNQVRHGFDQQGRIVDVVGHHLHLGNQLQIVVFVTTLTDVGHIALIGLPALCRYVASRSSKDCKAPDPISLLAFGSTTSALMR